MCRLHLPLFLIALAYSSIAETSVPDEQASAIKVARLIGLGGALAECAELGCKSMTRQSATPEGLFVRQQITEAVVAASLDVDSVLAEISSEHARLLELRSVLQGKRDRAVNLASTANLITGTGIGIAVNALQFKDSTALIGDGIGVASGVGSTILSIIGIRLQNGGPRKAVARSPNMLAQLLGRAPELHSTYPANVLGYLNEVPAGEPPERGSRLQQLTREWQDAGRLSPAGTAQAQKKVLLLTSTLDQGPKLSINDLTDRAYMLEDVAGRVALMNRDLALLLHRMLTPDR